jgi:hypothetical protein
MLLTRALSLAPMANCPQAIKVSLGLNGSTPPSRQHFCELVCQSHTTVSKTAFGITQMYDAVGLAIVNIPIESAMCTCPNPVDSEPIPWRKMTQGYSSVMQLLITSPTPSLMESSGKQCIVIRLPNFFNRGCNCFWLFSAVQLPWLLCFTLYFVSMVTLLPQGVQRDTPPFWIGIFQDQENLMSNTQPPRAWTATPGLTILNKLVAIST